MIGYARFRKALSLSRLYTWRYRLRILTLHVILVTNAGMNTFANISVEAFEPAHTRALCHLPIELRAMVARDLQAIKPERRLNLRHMFSLALGKLAAPPAPWRTSMGASAR